MNSHPHKEYVDEKADEIQQHFFSLGAKVSIKDYDFLRTHLQSALQKGRDEAIEYSIGCVRGGDDAVMTVIKRRIGAFLSTRQGK